MIKNSVPFACCPSIQYNYDLIKLYADASKRMTLAYLLLYCVVFAPMFFFIPVPIMSIWVGAAFIHLIIRHSVASKMVFGLEFSAAADIDKYLRWSIYISIYGGMLWGGLVWLSQLYLPHTYHYISIAITLGLAAAAIANLSMIFISYLAFLLSMMLTEIIVLLLTGEIEDLLSALMLLVYVIVIIPTARLLFRRTKESFELSSTLNESKEELACLNETLEERVREKTRDLQYSYYHDQLTGLFNLKKLSEMIQEGDENYIILLDIREFGLINKQYGKAITDKILISAAELLNQNLRQGISLFRAESDRFIIYCKDMSLQEIEEYVKQILSFFEIYPIGLDGFDIHIGFKAGISDIHKSDECLIHAEYALMIAKNKDNNYFIYDITQDELQSEKEIINSLSRTKELVLNENIYPVFQPIYDIKHEKIVKYECLARGLVNGETIAPYQFLDSAVRLGLTGNITRIMIDKSFDFFKEDELCFSVNISGSDLLDQHFIDFLDMKLKRYHIDPSRITFEVLENITTHSSSNIVLDTLNSIKQRGCKIAIDDFGVENSNFSRLLQIDLDFIKIDGLFIKNIHISEKDKKIVQSIVEMAKTLGVQTVAEFVETEEVLELLKECGVDYAQGYYIGKPQENLLEEAEFVVV